MSSARSVAREVLRLSTTGGVPDPLTYYRLQVLCYYAQAWSLVLRNSELFPDEIESQEEGPVIRAILAAKDTDSACQVVSPTAFDQEPGLDDEDEALFLGHLWEAYRSLSPSGLLESIEADPPFLKAKQEREAGGPGLLNMSDLGESFSRRQGLPPALYEYSLLRKKREKEAETAILSSPPLDVEAIWKGCRSLTPTAGEG